MWDLIVLVPKHCLVFTLELSGNVVFVSSELS